MATGNNRGRGEDQFSRIRAGAAKAREVIQRAIAAMLDADTSKMGDDEEAFVDALDSLNDPAKTMAALDVLDRLSARYERELPQVRRAVERIQRHLEPLMGKVVPPTDVYVGWHLTAAAYFSHWRQRWGLPRYSSRKKNNSGIGFPSPGIWLHRPGHWHNRSGRLHQGHRVRTPILMPKHDAERVAWFVIRVRDDHVVLVVLDCEPPHLLPPLFSHGGVVGLGNQDMAALRHGPSPVVEEIRQLVPSSQPEPTRELPLLHGCRVKDFP